MRKTLSEIRYAFYLTVHPFKGFWGIKHENAGSIGTALLLLAFFVIASVASGFYGGYLFNPEGGIQYDLYKQVAIILLVYLLWCIANWCLTSLFDGEGTFKDICRFTAYALLPLSLIQLILIPLSHALILEESSFYQMLTALGMLWTGLLLFIGTVTTHQYTVAKTILIVLISLLGMCIILYIMLLFFNLIQQIIGFAVTFWRELSLRMS